MRLSTRALHVVTLFALTGCTIVNSSDLNTSGMTADFEVVAKADGVATVSASLRSDSTTYVQLSTGDSVEFYAGSTKANNRTQVAIAGIVVYSAEFSGVRPGDPFRVELLRASETSALNSTAILPVAAPITSPVAGATLSRAAANDITWDAGDKSDSIDLTVSGNCLETRLFSTSNTGHFTLPAGALVAGNAADKCEGTVRVARVHTGVVDPAFGRGTFLAKQVREVSFTSAP